MKFRFALILIAMPFLLLAQKPKKREGLPSTPEELEKLYKSNIRKSRIKGVYIPKDLNDALLQLEKLSDKEGLLKFKLAPEENIDRKLHFGLGRWMIYNWNFYYGSRLEHYLKQMGLMHPDDMADFLIISFHRYLNKKPLNSKELIQKFRKKRWEKLNKKFKRDTVIVKKKPKDSGQ